MPKNTDFDAASGQYGATHRALAAVGMVDSPDGQSALLIARRLDASTAETGTAVAALVREHRNALRAALAAGITEDDPLDDILRAHNAHLSTS